MMTSCDIEHTGVGGSFFLHDPKSVLINRHSSASGLVVRAAPADGNEDAFDVVELENRSAKNSILISGYSS